MAGPLYPRSTRDGALAAFTLVGLHHGGRGAQLLLESEFPGGRGTYQESPRKCGERVYIIATALTTCAAYVWEFYIRSYQPAQKWLTTPPPRAAGVRR